MTFFNYPAGEGPEQHPADQSFLRDASEQDWSDLLRLCAIRRFEVGETLVGSGADDRSLLILLEGQVEVLLPSARKWRSVATLGAGSVVGEIAFVDGGPRSALVRAQAPTRVAELSRAGLDVLARTRPDLALAVALEVGKILARRLRSNQATV